MATMAKANDYSTQDDANATTISNLIDLLDDPHGLKRQQARWELVSIGEPAVPALLKLLKDQREGVRWEAAKALSQIGDPAAAPKLVEVLEDDNFGVRWLAAEGLICTGSQGLVPLLRALERHSDSKWLRDGAHHVIRSLVGEPTLHDTLAPVLTALEGIEPVLEAPPAAQTALCTLLETANTPI
jgi:HEAT repeat protein